MDNGNDPRIRRRVDREAMNVRDAEAWRLQRQGWSVRSIARELGMPASSVQRCLAGAQKLSDVLAAGEPGDVLAAAIDDELKCGDVTCIEDIERLSELERYRLRHLPGVGGDIERSRPWR